MIKHHPKVIFFIMVLLFLFFQPKEASSYAEININNEEKIDYVTSVGLKNIDSFLQITGATASCKGKVSVNPGYTADVLMQLQRKTSSGGWTNITFWTGTATGSIPFNTTKTYGNLTQNKTYRLFISANVYKNGAFIESASSTSIEITN